MDVDESIFEPKPVMRPDVLERQRTHESLGKRLYEAAWNDEIGEVATALGMGADPNYSVTGWTALHSAAGHGNMDMVNLLISQGASVNVQNALGEMPLHAAVYGKHKKVAEFLISKGARTEAKDDRGWTPARWGEEREADDLADVFDALGVEAS